MLIPLGMVIVAALVGLKFEHKFELPNRSINDERTMDEYRSDFDILD